MVAFSHCGKAVVFSSIDSEIKKNKALLNCLSCSHSRDLFLASVIAAPVTLKEIDFLPCNDKKCRVIVICNQCGDTLRGGGSRGRVQEGYAHHTPAPPPDFRLSITTGILQKDINKTLWFIGVEVKHETRLKNLC